MSTLDKLQEKLDNKTLNPNDLIKNKAIIDALIKSGKIKRSYYG